MTPSGSDTNGDSAICVLIPYLTDCLPPLAMVCAVISNIMRSSSYLSLRFVFSYGWIDLPFDTPAQPKAMLSHLLRRGIRTSYRRSLSTENYTASKAVSIFNPTEEHQALREMLRSFAEEEVDPQALAYNRTETFNHPLFKKLGELGLLGITVRPKLNFL